MGKGKYQRTNLMVQIELQGVIVSLPVYASKEAGKTRLFATGSYTAPSGRRYKVNIFLAEVSTTSAKKNKTRPMDIEL